MIKLTSGMSVVFVMALLSACAQLPTNYRATPSYAITDTENTALGVKAKNELGVNTKDSSMYLINDGVDAFVARLALLMLAEKTVDVQYYIWHTDLVGKLLLTGLLNAADRGVRVRIMLDDMPVKDTTEEYLYALDRHKNIEVRLFNPFASRSFRYSDYMLSPVRINRRMHNKSFTVDNQHTIIGGRNIGNEYFSADEFNNFKDIDVLAVGPIVKDVEKQFDIYWNSKVVYPVTAFEHNSATEETLSLIRKELDAFTDAQENSRYHLDVQDSKMYKSIQRNSLSKDNPSLVFKGEVLVVYDDPNKGLGKTEDEVIFLKNLVKPYVDNIDKTFELISPYFVPGKKGVEYLIALVDKGVRVRVVTNSLSSTDGLMAQSGYSRRRYDMLEGGVELYELKTDTKTKVSKSLRRGEKAKSGLHAKTYVFDREQTFIGSFNFDQRSADINSEVGVIYDVQAMSTFIAESVFDKTIKDVAYKVKIAEQDIETGDVQIEKGDIYWLEIKDGEEVIHDTEPETGFWRRFGQGLFSIMPIESQL
ncbi:MAG: phospholipase D family protein [Gammaproteobacteria bacterium]|nr:phospholipase D family protein [Gammaproteobacteria bacterium]